MFISLTEERAIMKKMNKGFTLAEVLITLAVIGIVAAVTLPSLTTGHTYKTLGVDLAKIFATTEGAARAYVVSNNNFTVPSSKKEIAAFANDVFLFKDDTFLNADSIAEDFSGETYKLKDGTEVGLTTYAKVDEKHQNRINRAKYGDAALGFIFKPNVKGLPSSVQNTFAFIMTESGYVYPGNDPCLWSIYENDWNTKASQFTNKFDESGASNACYNSKLSTEGGVTLKDADSQTTVIDKR